MEQRRIDPQRLVSLREERGLTQAQLAIASGLNRSSVWRIEEGKRSPSIDTIHAIAQALGEPITAITHLEPRRSEVSEGALSA